MRIVRRKRQRPLTTIFESFHGWLLIPILLIEGQNLSLDVPKKRLKMNEV